jgi:hypothetical protein
MNRSVGQHEVRSHALVLGLVGAVFLLQAALPEGPWLRLVLIAIQGAALLVALSLAQAGSRVVTGVRVVVATALALTVAGLFVEGDVAAGSILYVNGLLVALAPPAIFRSMRRYDRVELPTVLGAITIYVLIGLFFAFVFRALAIIDPGTFTGAVDGGRPAVFQYFSFLTLTTVGYGDVTAATDIARTLAVLEALIGQIYLVTIVALIVGNIGRERARRTD